MEAHVRRALEARLKRLLARIRRYGELLPADHPVLERLRARADRMRAALEAATV